MARAPFDVLVYPFRRTSSGEFEFALFKRADEDWWQAIAGGGEGDEAPKDAAQREMFEEAGITDGSQMIELDSLDSIPVVVFADTAGWPADLFVIPQHAFGVQVTSRDLVLSHEHSEYKWCAYAEAAALMKYDHVSLWELNARLLGRGPRQAPGPL